MTAGAFVGLGLTGLGYGLRYQGFGRDALNPNTDQLYGAPSLMIILAVLLTGLLISLGVAFIGLAYHHERRHRESLREAAAEPRRHATV
jgi:hypothetical protein